MLWLGSTFYFVKLRVLEWEDASYSLELVVGSDTRRFCPRYFGQPLLVHFIV